MKIDDKYKWLARDENGELWAYFNKPEKVSSVKMWEDPIDLSCEMIPENKDEKYSFIKWEDERPWDVIAAKMYADSKADNINKPTHYHSGNIDVIKFSEENFSKEEQKGFHRINAIKYITRYDRKNGVEDLQKARFYIDKLIEMEEQPHE